MNFLCIKLFNTLLIDLPKNIKKKFNGLDHEAMFRAENYNNILDPIIDYMIDDSNGIYVSPE